MFFQGQHVTYGASGRQSQGHSLQTCFSGRQTTTHQVSYNHKLRAVGLLWGRKKTNKDNNDDWFIDFNVKLQISKV